MDPIDAVRAINALLAAIALVWVIVDFRGRLPTLSQRASYLYLSLMAFLFSAIISSVEQIIVDARPGIRSAVTIAACVWTLIGLKIGKNELSR
jgi:hypothetical protein